MCIRDRPGTTSKEFHDYSTSAGAQDNWKEPEDTTGVQYFHCLLYTSDAADERSSVDLGGRRIIKKKNETRGGDARANNHKSRRREIDTEE